MHSFHQSRGRILFEAACALTVSASCVGAWMDLGVQAFLPAAAASALYGLVRLFDMRGREPAVAAVAPAAATMETDSQGDLLAYAAASAQAPAAGQDASFVELVEDAAPAEAAVPVEEPAPVEEAAPAEEPKPAAKPRARKPRARKAEPVPTAEPVVEAEPVEEAGTPAAEVEAVEPQAWEEPEEHAPVIPLFEPEPFVRQQRAVFGRKAG